MNNVPVVYKFLKRYRFKPNFTHFPGFLLSFYLFIYQIDYWENRKEIRSMYFQRFISDLIRYYKKFTDLLPEFGKIKIN